MFLTFKLILFYSNADIFEIRTNKYRTTREELFDGSYKSSVGFAPLVKNEKTVKIKIWKMKRY